MHFLTILVFMTTHTSKTWDAGSKLQGRTTVDGTDTIFLYSSLGPGFIKKQVKDIHWYGWWLYPIHIEFLWIAWAKKKVLY